MSFRRYTPATPPQIPSTAASAHPSTTPQTLPSGVKPASIPCISTGTSSLDTLLSPSSGLPISSSLLIEEESTGNYSGVILRQYVAEGVIQSHRIWIAGVGESWWRGIPALTNKPIKNDVAVQDLEEKMKIAWRYGANTPQKNLRESGMEGFCHVFDIGEQMALPGNEQVVFSPEPASQGNPYEPILSSLHSFIRNTSKTTAVRLVLPDLLNPLIYSPDSSQPQFLLQFFHSITSLVTRHPYATLLLSLSTSFYPRSQPLTSWIEHLCTHVLQLCPLPQNPTLAKQPQGIVNVHKGGLMSKEMAYRVGRRGMVLEEWSLPPLEEESPRVKQGFVIEQDVERVRKSHVSGINAKDLEF